MFSLIELLYDMISVLVTYLFANSCYYKGPRITEFCHSSESIAANAHFYSHSRSTISEFQCV